MERNWYIICTKANQEKKVTALLKKRKIESYCPFATLEKKCGTVISMEYQPIFSSYVFAFISGNEIASIKKMTSVVSIACWKSQPVIINKEEIEAIRLVTGNYKNLKIEKSSVSIGAKVIYLEDNLTSYSNNYVSIKPRSLKIVLPTLGYTIMAERANANAVVARKKFILGSFFS